MKKICCITGKKPIVINKVSHSNIKTKSLSKPNVHNKKSILKNNNIKSINNFMVSTKGCRIIRYNGGLVNTIFAMKTSKLDDNMKKLKKELIWQLLSKKEESLNASEKFIIKRLKQGKSGRKFCKATFNKQFAKDNNTSSLSSDINSK